MAEIELVKPTIEYKAQVLAYKKDFIDHGEKIYGSGGLARAKSYEEWLDIVRKQENPKTCPKGRVPATQFLVVRTEDDKVVGMLNIRHRLDDYLKTYGGHIGGSTISTERRKGYARSALVRALEECKALGIKKVLITCDEYNIGSIKVLESIGAKLEKKVVDEDGEGYILHYTIPTSEV